jgi:hypothetical protein
LCCIRCLPAAQSASIGRGRSLTVRCKITMVIKSHADVSSMVTRHAISTTPLALGRICRYANTITGIYICVLHAELAKAFSTTTVFKWHRIAALWMGRVARPTPLRNDPTAVSAAILSRGLNCLRVHSRRPGVLAVCASCRLKDVSRNCRSADYLRHTWRLVGGVAYGTYIPQHVTTQHMRAFIELLQRGSGQFRLYW